VTPPGQMLRVPDDAALSTMDRDKSNSPPDPSCSAGTTPSGETGSAQMKATLCTPKSDIALVLLAGVSLTKSHSYRSEAHPSCHQSTSHSSISARSAMFEQVRRSAVTVYNLPAPEHAGRVYQRTCCGQ